MSIPFNRDYPFEYATVETMSPLVRRVVARNPSAFTFMGTGTFIIGRGNVAIIDPGPLVDEHIEAQLRAVEGETVTHLLITHTHRDHSPASAAVQSATGATTYGYGPHGSGWGERAVDVEEGGDMAFTPDVEVRDGDVVHGDGWSFECVFTPGHTSNHMCYHLREENALFSGDHVMGWSTTIVSPPDGDMARYIDSLERLLSRNDARYWPTHGPAIDEPHVYVRALIEHRLQRARECKDCIGRSMHSIDDMVTDMYTDLPKAMHPAAARSVLSTLMYLVKRGEVRCDGHPGLHSRYTLAD